MKIVVLGGGHQGSVIARDLKRNGHDVRVADIVDGPGVDFALDLNNRANLMRLLRSHDIAVCALPASMGYMCVRAAIETGTHMVDLSFSDIDYSELDDVAAQKEITIIHDAGVAPGISNLVTGWAMLHEPKKIEIIVGGVPQNKREPFGYTITWSLDDLMEEYTRPARILVDGNAVEIPALSGVHKVEIGGEEYEIFFTDGLRSILNNNGGVPVIVERTLRWPGHVKSIEPFLVESKERLKQEMTSQCKVNAPDRLVMSIRADDDEVSMVVNSTDEMSAMARTTALACSAFTMLIADEQIDLVGVIPPEKMAANSTIYKYILDKMATHGVEFSEKYPFVV